MDFNVFNLELDEAVWYAALFLDGLTFSLFNYTSIIHKADNKKNVHSVTWAKMR
jgi:hypothetical protein